MKNRAPEDISIFPMAIPMIAGPGSIATAMLLTSHRAGIEEVHAEVTAEHIMARIPSLREKVAGEA